MADSSARRARWPALLVFLLALALRLAHVLALSRSPYFTHPVLDAETYHEAALALVRGLGYPDRVFWQPPGYPYFLALVIAATGSPFWAPRLVQSVLGALTALLTWAVGCRAFGPGAGLVAGLGVATYGTLIYLDGELLAPSLAILLQMVATYLAVRARATPAPAGSREWLGAGLFGGLTGVVNAPALLLVPVLALFARRRAAWVLLGAALAVAPVTARNWVVGHDLVLVSSNGGINLFIGNNPRYDRMVSMRPGRDWQALLRAPRQAGVVGPAAASRFFVARVADFARADPAGFLRLQLEKLRLLVGGDEILRNQEIYPFRAYSPVLRILLWKTAALALPLGLWLPLGVLGLTVGARRASMLAAMLVALAGAVVAFFVTARYRAPLVPLLVVFGAEGLRWLTREAGARGRAGAAVLLVSMLGLSSWGQGLMPDRMNPDAEFALATWLEREGRRAEAGELYRAIARENPTYWDAWYRLGQFLEAEGRAEEATAAFRTARAIVPEYFDTLILLANILASEGRWAEAADYYRRAAALEPRSALARQGLERALGASRPGASPPSGTQ